MFSWTAAAVNPRYWAGRPRPPLAFSSGKIWLINHLIGSSRTSESTRPITVLHIAESFSSGVASAIHACVEAQPADVEAMAYGYRIPGVQLAGEVDLPVPFYDLPAGKLNQLRAIRSIVAEQRPDVLHLHSSWAGFLGASFRSLGLHASCIPPTVGAFSVATSRH